MAFDYDKNQGGGDGPEWSDDDKALAEIANAALMSLELNCEIQGLPIFNAGMMLMAMMGDGIVGHIDECEGDEGSVRLALQTLEHMERMTKHIQEGIAKWQTTH